MAIESWLVRWHPESMQKIVQCCVQLTRRNASGGKSARHGIADGPAKIAQAMKITKSQYGEDLVKSDSMYVTKGAKVYKVRSSSRIGVSKGSAKMWNFTCSLRPLRAPKGQTVR